MSSDQKDSTVQVGQTEAIRERSSNLYGPGYRPVEQPQQTLSIEQVDAVMEVIAEWKRNDRRGFIEEHEAQEALLPEIGSGWVLLTDLRSRLLKMSSTPRQKE
jgi:hypothetical protein